MYLQSEKFVCVLEQLKGQVLNALVVERRTNFNKRHSQTSLSLLDGPIRHVAVLLGHRQDALIKLPGAGRFARKLLDFTQVISFCKRISTKAHELSETLMENFSHRRKTQGTR